MLTRNVAPPSGQASVHGEVDCAPEADGNEQNRPYSPMQWFLTIRVMLPDRPAGSSDTKFSPSLVHTLRQKGWCHISFAR